MKTENFLSFTHSTRARPHSQSQHQPNSSQVLSSAGDQQAQCNSRRRRNSNGFSDRDSVCSVGSVRGKRQRGRNIPMKSSKALAKKNKAMDYTNYAYNEAVGRLKLMLADSYATPKGSSSYLRHLNEDSGDNFSDTVSVIERPIFSDISKYLSPSQKSRMGGYRAKPKSFGTYCSSKENLALPLQYQSTATTATAPLDYYVSPKPPAPSDSVHAPVEIFSFIEKQEDYIEQLEKESKYCRNELTNLLGKVKDVINENEQLTETARSELAALSGVDKSCRATTSPSSDSDEHHYHSTKKGGSTPRSKNDIGSGAPKSPRYASAPNIVYEARISELEAELMQANIDLKRLKTENEELKRKLAHTDPLQTVGAGVGKGVSAVNCETHRKQIEHLQLDKAALEDSIRQLQRSLDEAKSQQYSVSSKRYINDLMQMERSQSELEVKHLREELDRQHERVRELQHEMARRVAEERANAERRYNTQVDQLGGDLSSQWEQVAKLQLELERQKRYESDTKRDLANRNAQIEELKMELRSNRSTFLADMAQVNAEKQSLEQEITALRLQLDRSAREAKTEAARLNAEISSLRQRLDRGDADLLHSKREVLRLNDEIANLEKELAYGELKNEIRPTKKDLDKRISEMQEKHEQTHPANFLYETPQTTATQQNQQQTATTSKEGLKATATATTGTTSAPALTTTITTASGLCNKTNAFPLPTYETHSIIPPTTTTTEATTTTTTTSVFPLAPTTTTTTTHPSTVSANVCASLINEQADESNNNNHNNEDDDAVDDNADDDVDDILANIRKSNRRLERELAKMPPLPKLPPTTAYKRHNSSNNKSSTNHTGNKCYHCRRRSAFGKANNCISSSNNSSKDVCLCCTYNNDINTYSNSNHNNTYSNISNSNQIAPLSGSKFSTPPNEPPCVRKTFYQTHHKQSVYTPPTTFPNSITSTTETKNCMAPFSHNSHLQCTTTRPHQQQQQHKQHHHEPPRDAHAKAKFSACRHLHELCRDRACTRTSATAETHLQSGSCSSRGYQRSGACHVGGVATVCCQLQNCKTEPLPWLQQHLVLNQTFSGFEPTSVAAAATTAGACSDCQSPSQATHLTDHTEHLTTKTPATEKTTTTTTTTKTMKTSTAKSSKYLQSPHGEGAYKPRSYFEELLRRDACCSKRASTHERCLEEETLVLREHCAKKPRPPVKVDVNVRLVPKPAKTAKAPKLAKESAEKRMERKNEELEKMESDIEQDLEQEELGAVGGYDLPLDTVQLEDVDEPVDEQI